VDLRLEELTNKQLQEELAKLGLKTYGAKDALIARLTKALAEAVEGLEDNPVEEKPAIIIPTHKDVQQVAATNVVSDRAMEEMAANIRQRFNINCTYNKDQEVFVFDGGLRGRITTTAHQPERAVISVASDYAHAIRMPTFGYTGIGKVGSE
jgi:hypothetical protein